MTGFETDWLYGLIGGLMIGSASAFYLFFNGRVAGISGILGGFLSNPASGFQSTGLAFLVGLIAAPAIFVNTMFDVSITITDNLALIILGGLLVGFGTRLGSGCTSGHGVCGMSRLSVRSITATCTFMLFAGITVFVTRHLMGL